MELTTPSLLSGLYIAVAILLLVVLYHTIFIVVDVRKIVRRFEMMTDELETVIMKPLSMTDQAIDWVMQKLQDGKKHQQHHHKHEEK